MTGGVVEHLINVRTIFTDRYDIWLIYVKYKTAISGNRNQNVVLPYK